VHGATLGIRGFQLLRSRRRHGGDLTGKVSRSLTEDRIQFAHGCELLRLFDVLGAILVAGAAAGLLFGGWSGCLACTWRLRTARLRRSFAGLSVGGIGIPCSFPAAVLWMAVLGLTHLLFAGSAGLRFRQGKQVRHGVSQFGHHAGIR